jgi:hypothetical protein
MIPSICLCESTQNETSLTFLWDIPFKTSPIITKSKIESMTGCSMETVTSENGIVALRSSGSKTGCLPDLSGRDISGINCFFNEYSIETDENGQKSVQPVKDGGLSDIYVAWALGDNQPLTATQALVKCGDIYSYFYDQLGGDLVGYFWITYNDFTYYCPAYQDGKMSLTLLDWVFQNDPKAALVYIKDNFELRLFGSSENWFMTFHESNSPIYISDIQVKDIRSIDGLLVPEGI